MKTHVIEVLARRALYEGGSFRLEIRPIQECRKGIPRAERIYKVGVTARMKLPGTKAVTVSSKVDADGCDIEVDVPLRELLGRVNDLNLDLDDDDDDDDDRPRHVDPVIAEDKARLAFLTNLTPTQRTRAQVLLRMWHDFKTETMSGWRAEDVEPLLASPQSCSNPAAVCGSSDTD